jgi:hypothetical protein
MVTPPLDPEYHSARLLLLIESVSRRSGSLDGLTKLAKLDFLVRYPNMLRRLLVEDSVDISAVDGTDVLPASEAVESRMMRYKYGPWDNLYYPLVGSLISRGLLESIEGRGSVTLRPTASGSAAASALRELSSWAEMAERCELAVDHFNLSGNALKERIYADLPEAVDRPIRGVI